MAILICPQCGEQNPEESVMCWACYTPSSAEVPTRNHKKKFLEITIHREAKDIFRTLILWVALSLCMVSGYLADYRLALLATGALCMAVLIVWDQWDRRISSRQAELNEDEKPLERILNTILLYGVRDGASQIRLRAGIGIQVHYLINGEWCEQMRIPHFIWVALRSLLREKTDDWQSPIPFAIAALDGLPFACWPEYKVDPEYPVETVLLTLCRALPTRPKSVESKPA